MPAEAVEHPVVGFSAAAYSGTEGDPITIELRLSEAATGPARFHVLAKARSAAEQDSDYSFGEEGQWYVEEGQWYVEVEIPAGETSYSYDISTVDDHLIEDAETFTL